MQLKISKRARADIRTDASWWSANRPLAPLLFDDEPRSSRPLPQSRRLSMINGMTTEKIAVSLPSEILRGARRAVKRGRAGSVSAYVASALEQKVMLDDLDDLLTQMLARTGGPLTDGERRRVDRLLDGVLCARRRGQGVVTSDVADLRRLDPSLHLIPV